MTKLLVTRITYENTIVDPSPEDYGGETDINKMADIEKQLLEDGEVNSFTKIHKPKIECYALVTK
jgi:hypothetical protein